MILKVKNGSLVIYNMHFSMKRCQRHVAKKVRELASIIAVNFTYNVNLKSIISIIDLFF